MTQCLPSLQAIVLWDSVFPHCKPSYYETVSSLSASHPFWDSVFPHCKPSYYDTVSSLSASHRIMRQCLPSVLAILFKTVFLTNVTAVTERKEPYYEMNTADAVPELPCDMVTTVFLRRDHRATKTWERRTTTLLMHAAKVPSLSERHGIFFLP